MKNQFENLQGAELSEALEMQAFSTTEETVERELDMQQKHDFAFRQSAICEIEMVINDEIADFVKGRREEIKNLIKERKENARITKRGYIEAKEKVYWIQDFDTERGEANN